MKSQDTIPHALSRIDEELLNRVHREDVSKLSLEALVHLRTALTLLFNDAKKQECTCQIVSIDDDPNATAGWQCKCYQLKNPNRRLSSFSGPGFNSGWVGGNGGAAKGGNMTENVVNPVTGEAFVVEYKCTCPGDAM